MKKLMNFTIAGMCLALLISFSSAFAAEKKDLVTPQMCDAQTNPREKEICLIGLKIQLDKQIKKAKKEREKKEPPVIKEARKLVEKGEKNDRSIQKKKNTIRAKADLQGCEWDTDDTGNGVWVSPLAERDRGIIAMATVRVVNNTPHYYDIETTTRRIGMGVVVKRLCPGASLSLNFVMRADEGMYKTFELVAISRPQNSRVYTETHQVSIYWSQQELTRTSRWEITAGRSY